MVQEQEANLEFWKLDKIKSNFERPLSAPV